MNIVTAVLCVVCALLTTVGVLALSVVMIRREWREAKRRKAALASIMDITPERRELAMATHVQQKVLNELWEVPLAERPFLVMLAQTHKGKGQIVLNDPDEFRGWDHNYRHGAGARMLRLIGTCMANIEKSRPNTHCLETLIDILQAEQRELAKRPKQPTP